MDLFSYGTHVLSWIVDSLEDGQSQNREMFRKHKGASTWSNVFVFLPHEWICASAKPQPSVEDIWIGLGLECILRTKRQMWSKVILVVTYLSG